MAAGTSSKFQQLAITHAAMMGGEAAMVVALADSFFFDVDPNGARSKVLGFLLVSFAPFLIVAPLIGPAIDRVRGGRRFVVQAVAAARIVVQLLMIGFSDDIALFPLVFVALVLQKTYAVSKSALVPAVVRSDRELVEANSKLGADRRHRRRGRRDSGRRAAGDLFGSTATLAYGAVLFGVALVGVAAAPARAAVATRRADRRRAARRRRPSLQLAWVAMLILRAARRVHVVPSGVPVPRAPRTAARCCSVRRSLLSSSGRWPATRIAPSLRRSLHEERLITLVAGAAGGRRARRRRRSVAIGQGSPSPSS